MSARRRKKRLQLTPKQAFASLLALAAAFLVVVLIVILSLVQMRLGGKENQ